MRPSTSNKPLFCCWCCWVFCLNKYLKEKKHFLLCLFVSLLLINKIKIVYAKQNIAYKKWWISLINIFFSFFIYRKTLQMRWVLMNAHCTQNHNWLHNRSAIHLCMHAQQNVLIRFEKLLIRLEVVPTGESNQLIQSINTVVLECLRVCM